MNIPARIYRLIDFLHGHPEALQMYYVLHGDAELKLLEQQLGEQRVDVPFLAALVARLEVAAYMAPTRGGVN